MGQSSALSERFQINDRFRRSVNLAADYAQHRALHGYVITPLVESVLRRIGVGLSQESLNRAWSLTGPYGAGKSACVAFLAQVLGYPINETARELLRQESPETSRILDSHIEGLEHGGFLVVPVVGSRQPLAWSLLEGLIDALSTLADPSSAMGRSLYELELHLAQIKTGRTITPSKVVQSIEQTAKAVAREIPSILGILVLYDELGKSLEYATQSGDGTDVGILQILAETASRSRKPVLAVVTILHQAFEQYASLLSPVQRREWEKVQGRFEDIGFLQTGSELLLLMDKAIESRDLDASLRETIRQETKLADELRLLPREINTESSLATLEGCAPLHPTVALLVGKLFRSRLAQNERSLFAFLSSSEPYGLQEYLSAKVWRPNGDRPFFRLDQLYDYVHSALGSGLYLHAQGKRWAEIEEALVRLPADSPPLDARVIKTIGLLDLLGDQRRLKASPEVLRYALSDGHIASSDVDESLQRLRQHGIAIYRSYRESFGLWQGSDIDLDECYQNAAGKREELDLIDALERDGSLVPYIAKRHLHEKGTLRYFEPWIVDIENVTSVENHPFGQADGAVVFALPSPGLSDPEARRQVRSFSATLPLPRRNRILFAIPHQMHGIREGLEELAAWKWVASNTPELEGDSAARRELKARQLAARERLGRAIERTFDLSVSYGTADWVYAGRELPLGSARELAATLSDVCDEVYCDAPIVRNELINRRSLSSAAAGARRSLIERMLADGSQERLGLEGYPPEASIYLSVLEASGLHHREGDRWVFGPADGEDPLHMRPMWKAMDTFFASTENGKRPINDLYAILSAPPFGIKEGLLPIFLSVAMLHWDREIALYEEGTFVPRAGIAEYERLLRAPERFEVQRYRLNPARVDLLVSYVGLFRPTADAESVSVLDVVRALVSFAANLPEYTRLTDRVPEDAQAVRETLLHAQEPHPLLFGELPAAMGYDSPIEQGQIDAYQARLRPALIELQQAYGSLQREIANALLEALRLPPNVSAARQEIRARASDIRELVTDSALQAFLFRLSDSELDDTAWLESVASMVVNKPPRNWTDTDAKAFRIEIVGLGERLRRVEEVALSKRGAPPERRVLRLGITDASGRERGDLLHIRPEQEPEMDRAMGALEATLEDLGLDAEGRLAALALLAQQILDQRDPQGEEQHEQA